MNPNRSRAVLFLLISAVALLTGCQSARKGLPAEYRSYTAQGEFFIDVPQAELNPSIRRSNMTTAMGGGLVWALTDAIVDNIETGNAEDKVASLRNKLIDYSFEDNFIRLLEQKLAEANQLRDDVILEAPSADKTFIEETLKQSNKALAVLSSSYVLRPDCNGLVVRATLRFYVPDADKSNKPVYHNTFTYWHNFPGMSDDVDANLTQLNANPGMITTSINNGQSAIIDMMIYDFRLPEELEGQEQTIGEQKQLRTGFSANDRYSYGKLITQLNGITWYRLNNDAVFGLYEGN